ncbi:HpcH/HpaI aldolase family protein [Amorphus orientalis]|uniref:2-keto-3-deoxy-L-rhamnonate aldolase RhmA n=1 Tax=Amorphus orientalis TaxID=649198 RepID=A0AAE3VR95_9HYPH|nr:aldolase/citrate lyase family protein [Amorphus orientalis]MDQ0316864.1 2-keto-3-deoxy-L-rhamnonate aldolase RhmA [Amorphus orientalis]
MIKSNPVKALWAEDKPAFGTWITLCPHPRVVKILAVAGFDFVLIEMEHTDFSMQTVGTLAMYARECGLAPIVRPAGTLKPHDLTRPLDAGAQGLLLPSIDDASQLEAIIKQVKYYPIGNRPMNLKGPHTDYFVAPPAEVIAHLNQETLTVAMVETRKSIDNLEDILKVEGLDAIMIGPDDLSQDLGVPGDLQAKVLHEAYDEVFGLCKKHGVTYGLSAQSPEMAGDWVSKGCKWIPYQNDAAMVFNTARAAVPKLHEVGGR